MGAAGEESGLPATIRVLGAWLSPERFKQLLSYPYWSQLQQFIVYTRQYESGLDIGRALERIGQRYRHHYDKETGDMHQQQVLLHVLKMLDKLDRWDDYAQMFDELLSRRMPHGGRTRSDRKQEIIERYGGEYVVSESAAGLRIHFLIAQAHRRSVIQRKIERMSAGKSTKHLRHATYDDLPQRELKRRVKWLHEVFASLFGEAEDDG